MKTLICCAAALAALAPAAGHCAPKDAAHGAPAGEAAAAPGGLPAVPAPWFGVGDPWMELRMMQDRINRVLEEGFGRLGPRVPAQWALPAPDFLPDVDVAETEKAFIVTCDLPGLEKEKIEVVYKDGALFIRGSREVEREEGKGSEWYVRERSAGAFERIIPIAAEVKEAEIKAEYRNGVLTVTLPKAESATRPGTKIKVI